MVLTIPLTIACQGANNDDIDPVLMEHVKSVIDFYPDCGKILKVHQFDTRKVHAYYMWPKQSSFWFDNDRLANELRFILPTNAIKYKDKYILFYLNGKKPLSEKRISKILGITSKDTIPEYRIDPRIWVYMKNKRSKKSTFVQVKQGTSSYIYPKLRYFEGGEKDSAIIDMVTNSVRVHGETGKLDRFSDPDRILIGMSVLNKSDSVLLLGLNHNSYGSFIIKNGEHSIPLTPEVEINKYYSEFHEYSPGLYSIVPHGEMYFTLKSPRQPIILKGTPPQEYVYKLYDLFYDSIYYVPAHSIQIPDTVQGMVWNKKFKSYFSMAHFYNFWVNDSIYYTIYPNGEIDTSKVKGYMNHNWFKE